MQADGTGATLLTTALDRQCAPHPDSREPLWDGDRIVFTVEDGGNVHVYAVAADGGSRAGAARRRRAVDLRLRRPRRRARLRVLDAHDDARAVRGHGGPPAHRRRQLVHGGRELVEAERFTAVSKDGTEVDAWLVRPAGFEAGKRYPVLLSVHGGPFTQYGTGFFDEFQVYAGAGYAVLFANPRGGSGYTRGVGPRDPRADRRRRPRLGHASTTRTCSASSTPRSRSSTSSTPTGWGSSAARTAAS